MDPNFKIRELELEDYDRGYIELLGSLTETDIVTKEEFTNQFAQINKSGNYIIKVIVDTENNKIVGSGTLLIEHKFIHKCASKGHIEDIVVHPEYRKKGFGKHIIKDLVVEAEVLKLYKISLVCREGLKSFYEGCGFKMKEVEMVKYFD